MDPKTHTTQTTSSGSDTESFGDAEMARHRPVHEIRIGAIKASVWENETAAGTRHSVTLGRLYKDVDDRWRTTSSLGRDDLLTAAKVLDQAHTWLHQQQAE